MYTYFLIVSFFLDYGEKKHSHSLVPDIYISSTSWFIIIIHTGPYSALILVIEVCLVNSVFLSRLHRTSLIEQESSRNCPCNE